MARFKDGMSYWTDKPTGQGLQPGMTGLEPVRGRTRRPGFDAQVVRSVRMHPLVASVVAAVVLLVLVGLALQQKTFYLAESRVRVEPSGTGLAQATTSTPFDPARPDAYLDQQMNAVQQMNVLVSALLRLPASTWQEFGPIPQAAATTLRTQLRVARIRNSYGMSVGLKGSDPVATAEIVNAITTAYLEAEHELDVSQSGEQARLLEDQRRRIDQQLLSVRSEQQALGVNPASATQPSVAVAVSSETNPASDEAIAADSGLTSMKASIRQRRAIVAAQLAIMAPTTSAYRQSQQELVSLDRTLHGLSSNLADTAAGRLQENVSPDPDRNTEPEASLDTQEARQGTGTSGAASRLQRSAALAGYLQRLEKRRTDVEAALDKLQVASNRTGIIRLAQAAIVPQSPEPNGRRLLLLLSFPMALLLGAAAAVFARKRDRRVYTVSDVEDVLGFAPMAVLPARTGVAEAVFEEYVLRLAAGVESASRTHGAHVFLLTAVSASTDIEPLCSALRRTMKDIGVRATVVSASAMLQPHAAVTAAMPSGTDDPFWNAINGAARAVDAAGESFVAANFARLRTEPGVVLIAAQPLMQSAPAEYVARCTDATILVIESGVTTRGELVRALGLLRRIHASGVGAVLEELVRLHSDSAFEAGSVDRRDTRSAWPLESVPVPVRSAHSAELHHVAASAHPVSEPPAPEAHASATLPETPVQPASQPEQPRRPERGPEQWFDLNAAHEFFGMQQTPLRDSLPSDSEPGAAPEVQRAAEYETSRSTFPPVPVPVPPQPPEQIAASPPAEREGPAVAGVGAPTTSGATPKGTWAERIFGRRSSGVTLSILPTVDQDEASPPDASGSRLHVLRGVDGSEASTVYEPQSVPVETTQPTATEQPLAVARTHRESSLARSAPLFEEPLFEEPLFDEPLFEGPLVQESSGQEVIPHPAPEVARTDTVPRGPAQPFAPAAQPVATPGSSASAPEPAAAAPSRTRPRPLTFQELSQNQPASQPSSPNLSASRLVAHSSAHIHAVENPVPGQHSTATEESRPWSESPQSLSSLARPRLTEAAAAVLPPSSPHDSPIEIPAAAAPAAWADLAPTLSAPRASQPLESSDTPDLPHLTTGRWDPIPPLRPSAIRSRDRLSPIPESTVRTESAGAAAERRRWTGMEDDGLGTVPAHHRAGEGTTDNDPPPEPLLTRQWGLLSRFQQANLNPSERTRTTPPSDSNPLGETVAPGPSNGKRKT